MENYERMYKEALSRARVVNPGTKDHNIVTFIFPELKESEDERIKKELLNYLDERRIVEIPTDTKVKEEWIVWLEKQNSSISDMTRIEFKVGDWVIFKKGASKSIYQVEKIENYKYTLRHISGYSLSLPFSNQDLIRHWTTQDIKEGDVLYHKSQLTNIEYIVLSRGINNYGNVDSYFRYNSEDGIGINIPSIFSAKFDDIVPATKEQRELLFSKMEEAGYKWDGIKKELIRYGQ